MRRILLMAFVVGLLHSVAANAARVVPDTPQMTPDPTATFVISSQDGALPGSTVLISVSLHSDTASAGIPGITKINNRIMFDPSALTLVSIYPGAGVPEPAASSFDTTWVSGNTLNWEFLDTDGFTVTEDPVVVAEFTVNCFGYGGRSDIVFAGGDLANFYLKDGDQFFPGRTDGHVGLQSLAAYLYSPYRTALAGQSGVVLPVTYSQQVPGRPLDMIVSFDATRLEWVGASAGSSVVGTVSAEDLVVGKRRIVFNVDDLTPGTFEIARFTFNLKTSASGYTTNPSYDELAPARRVTTCGDTLGYDFAFGGQIDVPLHTADADIGNVSFYKTAAAYTVPFSISSNHPVNSFNMYFVYPNDSITFTGTSDIMVSAWGDLGPLPGTNLEVIRVHTPIGGGLLSGETVGFDLNFVPLAGQTYGAGTRFDIRFYTSPIPGETATAVRFTTDSGDTSFAQLTALTAGAITLTNPPVRPCCPALYTWNGERFALENTILAQCDGRQVADDVTDYYLMTREPKIDDGVLRFEIREDADAVSSLRRVELGVVDYPAGKRVQITKDGTVVSPQHDLTVKWARDHRGNDIADEIRARDDVVYQSTTDGWFDVGLGALPPALGANVVTSTFDSKKKSIVCADLLRSMGIDGDADPKLRVSLRLGDGSWKTIGESDARHNPVSQAVIIDASKRAKNDELVLRFSWSGSYRVDKVHLALSRPDGNAIVYVPAIGMQHSRAGSVDARLGNAAGGSRVSLSNGESLSFAFDVGSLDPPKRGYERAYVLVTTGRYTEPGGVDTQYAPPSWKLEANVPNPFNPSTTIRYSLAGNTRVLLQVFDINGSRVRTLVSRPQVAGTHVVEWDGRSEAGGRMASGVYFYRLETPGFTRTRKMVLLK